MSLFSQTDPINTIPSRKAKPQEWVQWHKDLKDNVGAKLSRSTTTYVWKKRFSNNAINADMKDYFAKQGINIERTGGSSLLDTSDTIIDNLGDFFSVGKYAVFATIGIAVVGVGMIVYNVAKNPIEAAKAASAFTPAGAASKAIR